MVHQGNHPFSPDLTASGLKDARQVWWNLHPATLIERAVLNGQGRMTPEGALAIETGRFTGRSPKDRFIVSSAQTEKEVWWGDINQRISAEHAAVIHSDIMEHLKGAGVYVRDAFVGADPSFRVPLRVLTETAWSNLFANNMFIRPSGEELMDFAPDWHVICAPTFKADPARHGTRKSNFAVLDFDKRMVLIGGTGYTGEIKKGMFSAMNFLLPVDRGVLPMHCSANKGADGDVAIFFGLSGTGKTTLSSDPKRQLIGDDEHGWSDNGVFNFEGGCYAKTINLSAEKEPDIFNAIRFGALLENIGFEADSVTPDYVDSHITENTRVSYPIDHINGALEPSMAGHPDHVFFLTCDAFGVLPPVALLDQATAMYHFISGYTAKVAGTEDGITEPTAAFSAGFGEPFLPLHPGRYAEMLGERMERHNTKVWLVNTGWTGGPYGTGHRMKLSTTRALLDAVLEGKMDDLPMTRCQRFGWEVPTQVPGVAKEVLNPRGTWADPTEYDAKADHLVDLFNANFDRFQERVTDTVRAAAPKAMSAVS
jgi:phosphoenolpyruvate carboxykinase (ATP)